MEHANEGSLWFWRLFGGAIIGLIGVLFVTTISGVNSNIALMRSELAQIKADNEKQLDKLSTDNEKQLEKLKDEIANIKNQLSASDEFKNNFKDRFSAIDSDVKNLMTLKEKLLLLEGRIGKLEPQETTK